MTIQVPVRLTPEEQATLVAFVASIPRATGRTERLVLWRWGMRRYRNWDAGGPLKRRHVRAEGRG